MTTHTGGFTAFTCDVSDALVAGDNEMVVSATNPLRVEKADAQVVGKQRAHPENIFYTGATGIWQTVWLEPVPTVHVTGLKLIPDIDAKLLHVTVEASSSGDVPAVTLFARDGTALVAQASGKPGVPIDLPLREPRLWSPSDPYLYDLTVALDLGGRTVDHVGGYFAMRKVSLGKDAQGRTRLFLNNQYLLEVGFLDQGYWPDGIFTAPTDEALRSDIQTAKKLGANLLRKHAKVEPPRWYYWTDRLGMLVWQDMPQAFGAAPAGTVFSDSAKQQWLAEWKDEIAEFFNVPSIIVWTTFNEGWGQHDTEEIVALTKQLDPTRLVNNASGWTDKKVGDIVDTHAYPGPWSQKPEETRAAVNGEFGGITESVLGHRWNNSSFGYGNVLQSGWVATKRYLDLFKTAYRLSEERGTSAFVYTQLTDVEQEINGVLTYDRAVIKFDESALTAATRGLPAKLPPNPHPDFVPTAQDEAIEWRYTTEKPPDGWQNPDFDDSHWQTGAAPLGHGIAGVRTQWTTADIWVRRHVTLPTQIPAKLAFNVYHDEDIEIYLDGTLAATAPGYADEYVNLPVREDARDMLKPGDNTVAAHVHQTTGGQGVDIGMVEAVH